MKRARRIALVAMVLWAAVFIAAATAMIYREIDGPTLRSLRAEVTALEQAVADTSEELETVVRVLENRLAAEIQGRAAVQEEYQRFRAHVGGLVEFWAP